MRKLLILTFSLFFSHFAYADTCPSVNDIKTNHIAGWTAYDSEDGKPFAPARLAQLSAAIEQFALAEWTTQGPKGSAIHCYYRDKHGSDLEAYLSKDNIDLDNKTAWYQVTGSMHCAAGADKCSFRNSLGTTNTLAKNEAAKVDTAATPAS